MVFKLAHELVILGTLQSRLGEEDKRSVEPEYMKDEDWSMGETND